MEEARSRRSDGLVSSVARVAARSTWQPDKWDRLSLVAEHVGAGTASVLDVGGRGHEMARLIPRARVLSANVRPPADIIVPGDGLPFADDSIEVVTSCDVIEHMPAEQRAGHLGELVRVARRRLVVCCPWGSPEKDAAELALYERLESELGVRADFLDEHIEFGLPRETDLRAMVLAAAPSALIVSYYQHDFEGGDALLMDGMRARYGRDPMALLRYIRRGYLSRRRPDLRSEPGAGSHRLFMIVDLTDGA